MSFHVFDPRHIEAILDGDLPAIWREEDAVRTAENRRRAAAKAALARARKVEQGSQGQRDGAKQEEPPNLEGWDEFDAEGLLR